MDKEYVVTLYRKEDLEQFYNEMQLTNFPLVLKRPLSRNTHYMMTEEQAERLRQDPRVWGVEAVDSFHVKTQSVNREPYVISGDFWKNDVAASTINPNLRQWGHLHCAGDQVQRRKGNWGDGSGTEFVNDTVEVFNNGRHVDVVIVDDPVSWDSQEWYSQSAPGQTRFVQYQWFNELNTAVGSIDDDGQTLPTGTITYLDNLNTPQYHGIHVTGTAAGQYYGWAPEANIYNIAVTYTLELFRTTFNELCAQDFGDKANLSTAISSTNLVDAMNETISIATSTAGLTIRDESSSTQIIGGGNTLSVLGTANQIQAVVSATDTLTLSFPNNVTIPNDLTVTGALNLSSTLGIASGGTGLTAVTDKSIMTVSSGSISFLTNTSEGAVVQFDSNGDPISSTLIDGGTYD